MDQKTSSRLFSEDDLLNDEIMKLVADIIQTDAEMEILAYEQKNVPIREAFDEQMLLMARSLDAERRNRQTKLSFKRFSRIAAVFLMCIISLGSITMGTSDAFRKRIIDVFYNESNGAVLLRYGDEEELIGDWEDFWYPTYVPEGFVLTATDLADHFLLFSNDETEMSFYIFDQDKNASVTFDTDSSQLEKIQIGYSDGYICTQKDTGDCMVTWHTEKAAMMAGFDGGWEKAQILEVLDNLAYVEKFYQGQTIKKQ